LPDAVLSVTCDSIVENPGRETRVFLDRCPKKPVICDLMGRFGAKYDTTGLDCRSGVHKAIGHRDFGGLNADAS
jgi:hypothetical protein